MSTYCTISRRRLHIAIDEDYQGNINSYNNFLTRAYAKMFIKTARISVDGETHLINKKSGIKFFKDLNVQLTKESEFPADFDAIPIFTVRTDRGLMRTHLSPRKAEQLGKKMIHALVQKDMHLAKKYIGQGAAVDQHFWYLEQFNSPKVLFKTHFSQTLPSSRVEPFRATRFTPLLYAAVTTQNEAKDFLIAVKASTAKYGERCTFKREIMDCRNNTSLEPTINTHVYVPPPRRGHRHPPRARVVHQVGVDVVNTQTLTFRDTYSNRERISLGSNGRVVFTPAENATHTVDWSSSSQTGRYQLL